MVEQMKQEVSRFGKVLAGLGGVGDDGVKDTELVHVNKFELEILKSLGGTGTINPKTGLREFKYGADTKEGGVTGKAPAGKSGGGGGGGGNNKTSGKVTGSTVGGMGVDSAGYGFNREDLSTKNLGNPEVSKNAKALKDKLDAQKVNQTNLSLKERERFAKALHDMQRAYNDSLSDGTGGIFSGLTPFSERNPYVDPDFGFGQIDPDTGLPQVDANWGFDYVGAILGGAGLVSPIGQVLNAGWKLGKLTGLIPEYAGQTNLGSSVFGGSAASPPTGYGAAALGGGSGVSSGASSPPQTDINHGGDGDVRSFGRAIVGATGATTAPPAPTAPAPEAQASPSVSSGPLPPGVSIIQPPVPIRNRDTGAWSSPFINGSGFSGGFGSIVRI